LFFDRAENDKAALYDARRLESGMTVAAILATGEW
jgi:hypothetical protein